MEGQFSEPFKTLIQRFREMASEMQTSGAGDKSSIQQLKQEEELVTKQGARVLKLKGLKQIAIENEDYMTAKNIKT